MHFGSNLDAKMYQTLVRCTQDLTKMYGAAVGVKAGRSKVAVAAALQVEVHEDSMLCTVLYNLEST